MKVEADLVKAIAHASITDPFRQQKVMHTHDFARWLREPDVDLGCEHLLHLWRIGVFHPVAVLAPAVAALPDQSSRFHEINLGFGSPSFVDLGRHVKHSDSLTPTEEPAAELGDAVLWHPFQLYSMRQFWALLTVRVAPTVALAGARTYNKLAGLSLRDLDARVRDFANSSAHTQWLRILLLALGAEPLVHTQIDRSVAVPLGQSLVDYHRWRDQQNGKHLLDAVRLTVEDEELEALGETPAEMRVTLSYFVEPNPSGRGWSRRHRYASHGFRFAVKGATESLGDFRRRTNRAALDEEEGRLPTTAGVDAGWVLKSNRNRGSIHSDVWTGTAADLARRDAIGVYPVGGWWKEKPHLGRADSVTRYALVVSIRVPSAEVDIYTPVAVSIGVQVPVTIATW
jgi:hypothetical protein